MANTIPNSRSINSLTVNSLMKEKNVLQATEWPPPCRHKKIQFLKCMYFLSSLRRFSDNIRLICTKINDLLCPLIGSLQRNKKNSTKINALGSLNFRIIS